MRVRFVFVVGERVGVQCLEMMKVVHGTVASRSVSLRYVLHKKSTTAVDDRSCPMIVLGQVQRINAIQDLQLDLSLLPYLDT